MRRTAKPIHYRRAESTIRNSLYNDKIDILYSVELPQVAKKICGRFAQIMFVAELTNRDKLQGAAVSSPRHVKLGR